MSEWNAIPGPALRLTDPAPALLTAVAELTLRAVFEERRGKLRCIEDQLHRHLRHETPDGRGRTGDPMRYYLFRRERRSARTAHA